MVEGKHYGDFVRYTNGHCIYVAYRKRREIFRGGETGISEALRAGKASWALDERTLYAARAKGCVHAVIFERDTGDKWVGKIDDWIRGRLHDCTHKNGSRQRLLSTTKMEYIEGPVKL
jgi:hypothetical protein